MRFNIFNLLSVGDKELVHSSMIKLLLELRMEDGSSYLLDKLGLDVQPYSIKKEHKVDNNRFDLFFEVESNNNEDIKEFCVIENKFKAIPSIDQLEKYRPNEDHLRYSKKILFVLSKKFISQRFIDQCGLNNWQLFYYFNFPENQTENDSLFDLVKKLSVNIKHVKTIEKQENDESGVSLDNDYDNAHPNNSIQDFKMLLIHYREHLKMYYDNLKSIIEPESVYKAFEIIRNINENKTFYLRNYLFYIQSKIEGKVNLELDKFSLFNDGGTNTNPCVGFVSKKKIVSNQYEIFVEFQGHNIRVGLYFKNEANYMIHIKVLKSKMRTYIFEEFHKKSGLNDKVRMEENISVRNIKDKKSSSTMVVKYDLSQLADKFYTTECLIDDVSKLLMVVYEFDA